MDEPFLFNADMFAAGNAWTWFLTLPIAIHLLLATAVIALAWALLSSRASLSARRRAERDDQQQVDNREFLLRRDAYLPAAEAIARSQEFLGKVPAGDLNTDSAQAIIDSITGALGKVHLVASEQTLKSTMAFATEFTTGFLDLAAKRQPLVELRNEIEAIDAKARHMSVERDHLLASISRLAGDGLDQHAGIWSEMNMRFDKLQREIASLLSQRSDKFSSLSRMRREFSLSAAQGSLRLARLAAPAYLALRRELGIPIDELDYRGLAQRNLAEIEKAVRSYSQDGQRGLAPDEAKKAKTPFAIDVGEAGAKPPEARLKMVLKRSV